MNTAFDALGRVLSAMVLLMCATMTITVALRYFLGVGSVGLQELSLYFHGTVIMLGAGYTLLHDGHVRVDIFYREWSARRRAWVDLLGTLLLLMPFAIFVGASSWSYVASAWSLLEGSPEAGGLPGVFLLKTMIPLMGVLLGVAGGMRGRSLLRELRQ
ncbi:MAG: TRAP transporter small permease subunit [Myxococcota bacterium]